MVRTTDCNFIVTVPGRVPKSIALVAHYDTWAGFSKKAPGADDNTSGEEVLKQYLLRDFLADSPPPLTHVYLFAGSEECGTRGLVSQVGLTVALSLISLGISTANPVYFLASIPFLRNSSPCPTGAGWDVAIRRRSYAAELSRRASGSNTVPGWLIAA